MREHHRPDRSPSSRSNSRSRRRASLLRVAPTLLLASCMDVPDGAEGSSQPLVSPATPYRGPAVAGLIPRCRA